MMSKFCALESPAEEAKRAWLLFSESWTQFEDSDIVGPNIQYPIPIGGIPMEGVVHHTETTCTLSPFGL